MGICCFNIINSHYDCYPGAIYTDVVKMYYKNTNMKHILFVRPFSWNTDFYLEMDDCIVTWLEILPISDSVLKYITENGCEAFEDILEESEMDILDLNRPSVA
ncbi:Suppressor of fused protein (SUFU) [Selenomonas sp. WCT3]|nr:Suppressor of fused protein (SUFU) [Selenomonas ruminantium]